MSDDIFALFVVVVVVAHNSSPSLVVVELKKISHRIWIVPYILGCQLCRACRALEHTNVQWSVVPLHSPGKHLSRLQ